MTGSIWRDAPRPTILALIDLHLLADRQRPTGVRCPDCQSRRLSHCPLDDAACICQDSGHWFTPKDSGQ